MLEQTIAKFDDEFQRYVRTMYPAVMQTISKEVASTNSPVLSLIALRISFLLEHRKIQFPHGAPGGFLRVILPKLTQELYALHWCNLGGSLYGASHHARSLMEIYAVTNYAIGNPKEISRRLRKFDEFRQLSIYQHYLTHRKALDAGVITQKDFDSRCVARPEDIERVDRSIIDGWLKLWKREDGDLLKITAWHSPATLENLLQNTKLNSAFKELYGHLCHSTHISPLSLGVMGNAVVMQKGQLKHVHQFASAGGISAAHVLELVDAWIGSTFLKDIDPLLNQLRLGELAFAT